MGRCPLEAHSGVWQVALMGQAFSKDGGVLAYSLSSGGSDWREVKFLSIDSESGGTADLADRLEHVKFSSMAWSHDNKCGPLELQTHHSVLIHLMICLTSSSCE